MKTSYYAAIDLKSFYASVECVERGLDPLTTNLLVADAERTEKTICLAVSPSLKAVGVPGRPRLFEAVQKVREANALRIHRSPGRRFSGKSWDARKLAEDPSLEIDYIVAPPRMAHYIKHSARIYEIYLKYVAPEDIHVYSVDEVFLDVTPYLKTYAMSPRQLVSKILREILRETGITAAAGIGTNLYLCKVAMDIVAKHIEPDGDGVRIAQLDERRYRELLWDHRPLTDFWRVGSGYRRKLEKNGMFTMGDVARCSIGDPNGFYNEGLLYKLFGVNAELLIDHAWGWESCTLADIKAYRPQSNSMGSGQVLHCPYTAEKAKLVLREMADLLVLDLVDKGLVTDQLVLTVGYDIENLSDPERRRRYQGSVVTDHYGRAIPKHAHGSVNLRQWNSSTQIITNAFADLFDRIVDPELLVRRINLVAGRVLPLGKVPPPEMEQLDLFAAPESHRQQEQAEADMERERRRQKAVIGIKKKYGKNAIVKGMNLEEGATAMDRNNQIGGHKA